MQAYCIDTETTSTDTLMLARTDIFDCRADRRRTTRTSAGTTTKITITASMATRTGSSIAQ